MNLAALRIGAERSARADMEVRRARDVFNQYAGMDAPELPAAPWSALQVRLARYEAVAYGVNPHANYVLGILEECGEYWEAGDIADAKERAAAKGDAIADAVIFSTQLATALRLDMGVLIAQAFQVIQPHEPVALGRLAHVVLKGAQRIRGMADPERYRFAAGRALVDVLANVVHPLPGEAALLELVQGVAEEVMKRRPRDLPTVIA